MPDSLPTVDIVGVGLNAADTLVQVPRFPEFNSKTEFTGATFSLGGQTASAMVACEFWGLRTRYIGKVGDDAAGTAHRKAFTRAGVEAHLVEVPDCPSQSAYILVDQSTGERTILWHRDPRLALQPADLRREWIVRARVLHVDGHDCAAAAQAACWAHEAGLVVSADMDNLYPGAEELLARVDYVIGSVEFPTRLTGHSDLLAALPAISQKYGCSVAAATLGSDGVLAWEARPGRFVHHPAYQVEAADTTGAGDIFHGAFLYGLLRGWGLERLLAFSCAAAGLNCTALGARGGIRPVDEIEKLRLTGQRRESNSAFARYTIVEETRQGKLSSST